jgi:hypothetical protein
MPALHDDMRRMRWVFRLIALTFGFLQAFPHRYNVSSEDGVSYLDIGDAYFGGEYHPAINGSWSPLYSWILGFINYVFHPSMQYEFVIVAVVNFLLFVFFLICFEFFAQRLFKHAHRIPETAWMFAMYAIFLWTSLRWIRVSTTTPDFLSSGLVLLASALVLSIESARFKHFLLFGLTLGLGYLAKAPLFLMAFVFIAVAFFYGRRSFTAAGIAAFGFLCCAAPFVVALSSQKGHLTFGEKGKLSYAWYVNPDNGLIPDLHWQGGPAENGLPKHPERKIFASPDAFEFATPIVATYPSWYDPSYWFDGLNIHFNLKRQLIILARNFLFCWNAFLAALVLLILPLSVTGHWKGWRSLGTVFIPAIVGISLNILASDLTKASFPGQPMMRHLAPYTMLLFAGGFACIRVPDTAESRGILRALAVVAAAVVVVTLFIQIAQDIATSSTKSENPPFRIAEQLKRSGLSSGMKVAIIGDDFRYIYWARLLRVRIIAQVPDRRDFWTSPKATQAALISALKHAGAERILDFNAGERSLSRDWQRLENTDYYMISGQVTP